MKDIIIANLALINMKTNEFLTRRDFIKTAGGIVGGVILAACQNKIDSSPIVQLTSTPFSPSPESVTVVETVIPFPRVEPITVNEAQTLIDNCRIEKNVDCTNLGVVAEDVRGGYFEGSFLFTFKDKNGVDYYFLNRGNTSEPKNTFEIIELGIDTDNKLYLGPQSNVGKPVSETLKYFVWEPNTVDTQGRMLITYQSDGTEKTALTFVIPTDNKLTGVMKVQAIIAKPTESEPPLPVEGPIADFAKKLEGTGYKLAWKDKTGFVLKFTDADKIETTIPEITLYENGEWDRKDYGLVMPDGTIVKFTAKGKFGDIKIENALDGSKRLDFPGWKVENGKWGRPQETVKGVKIELTEYTLQEMIYILEEELKMAKNPDAARSQSQGMNDKLIPESGVTLTSEKIKPNMVVSQTVSHATSLLDNCVYGSDKERFPVVAYEYATITIDGRNVTYIVWWSESGENHRREALIDNNNLTDIPKRLLPTSLFIKNN